jgi:hypothetical protein
MQEEQMMSSSATTEGLHQQREKLKVKPWTSSHLLGVEDMK